MSFVNMAINFQVPSGGGPLAEKSKVFVFYVFIFMLINCTLEMGQH